MSRGKSDTWTKTRLITKVWGCRHSRYDKTPFLFFLKIVLFGIYTGRITHFPLIGQCTGLAFLEVNSLTNSGREFNYRGFELSRYRAINRWKELKNTVKTSIFISVLSLRRSSLDFWHQVVNQMYIRLVYKVHLHLSK